MAKVDQRIETQEIEMIISRIRVVADSANEDEILKILFSVKGPTEAKIGCVSCHIFHELRNEHAILYEEVWQSKDKLYNHIRTDLYRNILAVLDMSSEPPDVEFKTISRISGMELIKEAIGYYDVEKMGQRKTVLTRRRIKR